MADLKTNNASSWRVTREGLMLSSSHGQLMIPFAEFGALVLALIDVMVKNREGSDGGNVP